jgi:hypothetical protein
MVVGLGSEAVNVVLLQLVSFWQCEGQDHDCAHTVFVEVIRQPDLASVKAYLPVAFASTASKKPLDTCFMMISNRSIQVPKRYPDERKGPHAHQCRGAPEM